MCEMPALFTRIFTWPLLENLVKSDFNLLLNRNVATIGLGVPASLRDLGHHAPGCFLVNIENVDASAGLGEGCGDRPPNPARAPGHDGDFMSETLRVASVFQLNTLLHQ